MSCLHIAHMDIRMSAILISMKLLTSARLTMVSLKFCFFPACISCSFFILSGFRHPALRFSAAQCVTFFNNRTAFFAVQCAVLFNCAMCSAFQLHISYLLPRNLLQNPLAVNRNPPVPLYAFPITGYNFF